MSTASGLETALELNRTNGWAMLPLLPFAKTPAIKGLFDLPPMDENAIRVAWQHAQNRIDHDRDHPEWRGLAPNLGVLLGASRLLQLDVDTPAEAASWKALCDEHGYNPGLPTVLSPGSRSADGTWAHHDGGHWFFRVPEGIEIPERGKVEVHIGEPGSAACLYGGKRLAVIPPSVRAEGEYVFGGGTIQELPPFLVGMLVEHLARQEAKHTRSAASGHPMFGTSEYTACETEWAWSEGMDVLDLLPEGYVLTKEERDGHRVYARPGASSERSIVAHPDGGCEHFPSGSAPAPLTIWTSNAGDFLEPLVADGVPVSVTKVTIYAARWYGGDRHQARQALGFRSRSTAGYAAQDAPQTAPETISAEQEPLTAVPETVDADTTSDGDAGTPEFPEPTWAPASIAVAVRDALLSCAWVIDAQMIRQVASAEDGSADWGLANTVLGSAHITTEQIAERLGGTARVERVRSIVRSLIPALESHYGLIVRERLLDADPRQFGVRTQPADRTAWAVWLPAAAINQGTAA